MNTVIIEKEKYIYKNKVYEKEDIDILIRNIGKRARIIILGENILIKNYDIDNKNLKVNLKSIINNKSILNEDTIMDYRYNKNSKKIYIYSIKQGLKVEKISEKLNDIVVIPVQFIIKDIIDKKIKIKDDYISAINIRNYIYIIKVKNKMLDMTITYEYSKDSVKKILEEKFEGENILIDTNMQNLIIDKDKIDKIKFIDLREMVDSEISKKQRFFTKVFCGKEVNRDK